MKNMNAKLIFLSLFFVIVIFPVAFFANPLVFDLGQDSTICEGNIIELTVPIVADSIQYSWSSGDTTQSIFVSSAGSYSVTVTSPNCMGVDSILITILPSPQVSLAFNDACFGYSTMFVNTSIFESNANIFFDFGDGNTLNSINDTIVHTYQENGQAYQASLFIDNNNGCMSSDTFLVQSLLQPTASFVIDSVCLNNDITLTNFSENTSDSSQVVIDFGDSNIESLTLDSIYSYSYDIPQEYQILLTVDNGNTCFDTFNLNTVIYDLPLVSFTGLNNSYCPEDPIDTLIGNPSGGVFTGLNVIEDPILLDSLGLYSPTNSGNNLNVVYTFVDINGCEGFESRTVQDVFPSLDLEFTFIDSTLCIGEGVDTIFVNSTLGTFTGDDIIDDDIMDDFVLILLDSVGNYMVGYEAIDSNNCVNSIAQNFSINSLPSIDLGNDTSFVSGQTIVLQPSIVNPNYNYSWSNGNESSSIEIGNPGFYIVTAIEDGTGCEASDTIQVSIVSGLLNSKNEIEEVFIYPNPSKENITLSIMPSSNRIAEIQLFNSVGELIFSDNLELRENEEATFKFFVNQYPKGFYYLEIDNYILRFVKN